MALILQFVKFNHFSDFNGRDCAEISEKSFEDKSREVSESRCDRVSVGIVDKSFPARFRS